MEKNNDKNYAAYKFFETLILIILIGAVIMLVLDAFFDQINEGYEEEDYDYSYDDYDYDYGYDDYDYGYNYDDYYYEENDNYYGNLNYNDNVENTVDSGFESIEDFMNSDEGKSFLEKSNQNVVNSNTVDEQYVGEDTAGNESADIVPDVEEVYDYYDSQKAMKEKFENQKKKLEIKDEGKSLNDEIMVSIKNNDEDYIYDVTLNTIFSKGSKIVHIDVQDINLIDGNTTKYIKVDDIPEDYDNYEFIISKRYYMEYYNELLNDNISFSSEKENERVKILMQNNSSKRINRIHFTILYLDNTGKLVDFETVQDYSIKANKNNSLLGMGIWDEKNREYLNFYNYDVILDYAETYGY